LQLLVAGLYILTTAPVYLGHNLPPFFYLPLQLQRPSQHLPGLDSPAGGGRPQFPRGILPLPHMAMYIQHFRHRHVRAQCHSSAFSTGGPARVGTAIIAIDASCLPRLHQHGDVRFFWVLRVLLRGDKSDVHLFLGEGFGRSQKGWTTPGFDGREGLEERVLSSGSTNHEKGGAKSRNHTATKQWVKQAKIT
jgi:hypothetical protein